MSRRRVLSAVDDPLDARQPARSLVRPVEADRRALYVRLPVPVFDDLARAAFELGCHKQDLVAALLMRHVDAHTPEGLDALRDLLAGEPDGDRAA